jgi:hypothetical protein
MIELHSGEVDQPYGHADRRQQEGRYPGRDAFEFGIMVSVLSSSGF